MVADIQQALKDYEAKAQIFNTREALFGEPATEYEQLAKLVKDFEPYASLWTTAADWQKWQREWLDEEERKQQVMQITPQAAPTGEPVRIVIWIELTSQDSSPSCPSDKLATMLTTWRGWHMESHVKCPHFMLQESYTLI